jgi:hypothetical protein
MLRVTRSLPANAILVVAVVAIAGYLLGVHRAPTTPASASGEKTRIASGAGILLEYPSSWQPVATAPGIPGLALGRPLVLLAPGGNADRAGLVSGQLTAGSEDPLPAALLAVMRGLPRSEVVALANLQAYRYSGLHLPGYDRALALYVIPNTGEDPTAVACYAPTELSPDLQECEQIVAQLTPGGQAQPDISPVGAYASRLDALIGALNRRRVRLRAQMHVPGTPAAVARLATALAGRFGAAAASLRALEAPPAIGGAQTALREAILRAADAYRALAGATGLGGAEYDTAQTQVADAEDAVNRALERYSLLGYGEA